MLEGIRLTEHCSYKSIHVTQHGEVLVLHQSESAGSSECHCGWSLSGVFPEKGASNKPHLQKCIIDVCLKKGTSKLVGVLLLSVQKATPVVNSFLFCP